MNLSEVQEYHARIKVTARQETRATFRVVRVFSGWIESMSIGVHPWSKTLLPVAGDVIILHAWLGAFRTA